MTSSSAADTVDFPGKHQVLVAGRIASPKEADGAVVRQTGGMSGRASRRGDADQRRERSLPTAPGKALEGKTNSRNLNRTVCAAISAMNQHKGQQGRCTFGYPESRSRYLLLLDFILIASTVC